MNRAPDWMLPAGISEVRRAQVERDWKARLRPVPLPVDVLDAACFPNISEAIEHARKAGDAFADATAPAVALRVEPVPVSPASPLPSVSQGEE